MLPKQSRLAAVVVLFFLFLQLSSARSHGLITRQDEGEPQPEPIDNADGGSNPTVPSPDEGDEGNERNEPPTTTGGNNATGTASATAVPTLVGGDNDLDIFNNTIPEGELPLEPKLTPAYGVAGILLIISGLTYATIGVKNPWLHTFFSVTLLGNLATCVLIIYVMTVPVSNAIQGAYLVAIVVTGFILGAGSTFFRELTEGLCCILGGFSLSMWILTLAPGGLIPQTGPKVAFITALSLGSFALFFSHYTRDYALIGLISFGGATAAVIGIDCYSRAGLKEFWAYVWGLNENLFPEEAVTYPVTKGMRVETAAIIIICLGGIISQLKLWRVIQERRAKKAAEKAEEERNLQLEEEAIGREVEEMTARDRRAWERVYGDGDGDDENQATTSGGSESGDLGNEKKGRVLSTISSRSHIPEEPVEAAEMDANDNPPEVPEKPPVPLMASENDDGSKVMVRVAADEYPQGPPEQEAIRDPEERTWSPGSNDDARSTEGRNSRRVSRIGAMSPQPEVVPLPFQVAEEDEENGDADRRTVDARSSVAGTYADDEEHPHSKRGSLVKRLSQGSTNLLRTLSHRTDRNVSGREGGESQEKLVTDVYVPHVEDDTGSLAATVDVESMDDDERTTVRDEKSKSIEITADLAGENGAGQAKTDAVADDAGTTTMAENTAASETPTGPKDEPSGAGGGGKAEGSIVSKRERSSSSSVPQVPRALTRDALPDALSRTALKYRTNEWVKHSTSADAPEPDEIQVDTVPAPPEILPVRNEAPVPVKVDELQQTAEDGVPPPAPSRAETAMSNYRQAMGRADSRLSLAGTGTPHEFTHLSQRQRSSSALLPPQDGAFRPASVSPSPADDDGSSSRNSTSPPPANRQDSASRLSMAGGIPYANPQTLMGRRESYIRNKPFVAMGQPGAMAVDYSLHLDPIPSEAGSVRDLPLAYGSRGNDEDDIPLSQRRALIRQRSFIADRAPSGMGMAAVPADSIAFNSHQPQRVSSVPSAAAREAQLANFRQSIATDLRAGTPIIPPAGRESGFLGSYAGGIGGSSTSLGAGGPLMGPPMAMSRDSEVQRTIQVQRSMMLREKEAEAQAKEAERWEKERNQRAFEQMMRSGGLLDAHREAMKRLQGTAKDQ